jgi:hypothetical protein
MSPPLFEGIILSGCPRELDRVPPADLRAARANRVFGTDKNHPYQKRGYG